MPGPLVAGALVGAASSPVIRRTAIFTALLFGAMIPLMLVLSAANMEGGEAISCPTSGTAKKVKTGELTPSQKKNAQIIADEGTKAGVGTEGIAIALATAFVESHLDNLDYGDRDSLGLFQQRPSAGWGTPKQIQTPAMSARAFFGVATHTNNPGLTDVEGWQDMPLTVAAQTVQASAFPDAYAKWETVSRSMAKEMVGDVAAKEKAPAPLKPQETADDPAVQPAVLHDADECYSAVNAVQVSGDWAAPMKKGDYTVGSPFGMRLHPISQVWKAHNGQDMAGPEGKPLYSTCDGTVVGAGMEGSAGNLTTIDCGGGVQLLYMHQSSIDVSVGQKVAAGDKIGALGTTGGSTGPHLHFEVRIGGTPTDPVPFLKTRGLTL